MMPNGYPQTEFPFELPRGYIDTQGNLHRDGTMRLATAKDEIAPLRDPRVRANEAYLVVVLLSQVITRLGTLPRITPEIVEEFFSADLAYLQELYRHINDLEMPIVHLVCPNCGHEFDEVTPPLGGS
ncbi:MAG: phage tail assembly protein [Anaerolineae bacterium]|nr:phage tail assembly protein [Anaerolineae bacterium]